MSEVPDQSASITLTARSTPFAGEPEDAAKYYEALGRVVCLWGRFEFHFTQDLMCILSLPHAAHLKRPLPVAWKQKVKLWRDAFQTIPEFEPHKVQALEFIEQANDTAQDRHVLQHSFWWGFKQGAQPLTTTFTSVKEKDGKWLWLSHTISLDTLKAIEARIDGLSVWSLGITFFIERLQPDLPQPKESDKSQ